MADTSYLWLVLGIVLVVFGALLLWEYIWDFVQLAAGVILIVVGASFLSRYRRPKARVRKK